jgi:hypothetical protein
MVGSTVNQQVVLFVKVIGAIVHAWVTSPLRRARGERRVAMVGSTLSNFWSLGSVRPLRQQTVLLAKVMGAIVHACVTSPCRESCIIITDMGRVTTERLRGMPLADSRAKPSWPATGPKVAATGQA